MQQLSNLDASFLYLESASTPMHICCILTFAAQPANPMNFQRFERHIVSRLGTSPVFRQRLVRLPADLDRPYWVDDRHFNIGNHLRQAQLRGVNLAEQRSALINRFLSQRLDPDYPLWEMLYIENGDDGKGEFSVVMKFHHAAVDGMSGEQILSGLLSANPKPEVVEADKWVPENLSFTLIAGNKLRALARTPKDLVTLASRIGHSVKRSRELRARDQQQQPPHFFKSPRSLLNAPIDSTRHLSSAHLSLETIKAVKNACPGSTVNDVVLAVCAGALRQHLDSKGQLPETPMVAMVPVSKRQGSEQQQGNLISVMLVSLATNMASPVSRLEAVHQNALKAKEYNREVAMEQMMVNLPSWTSAWFLKTYTRLRIAKLFKPVFNLIITNVPGSRNPLYMDGAQLRSLEGVAPIVDGMGLALVVTSYVDTLTISVTSTSAMAARAPAFIKALHDSLDELHRALVPEVQQMPLMGIAVGQ